MAGRRSIYVGGIGFAVGALLVGVVLPFAIDPSDEPVATGDRVAAGADIDDTTGSTLADDGVGSGPSDAAGQSGSAAPRRTAGGDGRAGSAGGSGGRSGGAGATVVPGGTFKVGFLILDIGTVGRAGINVAIDPAQQERGWRAYVDDVNARDLLGGGRKIEPVFATYDVLSGDSQRAACLSLTEDHKVFAVLGGFNQAAPNYCVAAEHATPMVNNMTSNPDSYYTDSAGRLITSSARSSRMFTNGVAVLDQAKALDGKKVGIVSTDANDPAGEATAHLQAALRAAGHQVAHTSRYPASGGESQVPIEVQQMRSKGVDAVFLLAGSTLSTAVVQGGDAQGFRPRYITTDWGAMFNDTSSSNMPNSYDGAWGVTVARAPEWRENRPEPALATECKQVYERVSKTKLAARGTNEYALTVINCDLMRGFVAGVRAAGGSVTQDQFAAAMGRVGPMQWASWGDGSFRPGKSDGGDFVLLQQWRVGCKCFYPVGDFRAPKV
jgi:ABC-type branched-subunit amino acid transport system substrate-binding protein